MGAHAARYWSWRPTRGAGIQDGGTFFGGEGSKGLPKQLIVSGARGALLVGVGNRAVGGAAVADLRVEAGEHGVDLGDGGKVVWVARRVLVLGGGAIVLMGARGFGAFRGVRFRLAEFLAGEELGAGGVGPEGAELLVGVVDLLHGRAEGVQAVALPQDGVAEDHGGQGVGQGLLDQADDGGELVGL